MQADAVADALRRVGCTVVELTDVLPGRGQARLLLAARLGLNHLFLVVDPSRTHIVTPAEEEWVQAWGGLVYVVGSPSEALHCLGESEADHLSL